MRITKIYLVALFSIALASCGGGGGGGSGSSSSSNNSSGNWYYHWNCNGDPECLATNSAGTPSGTAGPISGGQIGCNSLLTFGTKFWGIPPATQSCDNSPSGGTTTTYTIGGTVSGLSGTGLVLQNNGVNNLSVTANGSLNFTTQLPSSSTYAVTVLTQPSGQTCTVTNGNGTVNNANVTNITISCSNTTTTFSISGTVSGTVLQGVAINLTGTVTANTTTDASGNFSFSGLANGSYTVTPSLAGYTFSPVNSAVTVNNANLTANNFTSSGGTTYIYYSLASPSTAQTATLSANGTLTMGALTLTGFSFGASASDPSGTLTSWAAPWNNINQPKVQAMLFCGTNGKLAYVLLLSNADDPNRTTSTAPNLLSAIESAPQYSGMGVYTDCSGAYTSAWNNNLPLTNYYLWPNVFTTYSYATVATKLNNAFIFYEAGTPSNQDNYLGITWNGNSPFEVWQ